MVSEVEKNLLVSLFGTRIGLALCRSGITFDILCQWFYNNILELKCLKVRGIGRYSATLIYIDLAFYLVFN